MMMSAGKKFFSLRTILLLLPPVFFILQHGAETHRPMEPTFWRSSNFRAPQAFLRDWPFNTGAASAAASKSSSARRRFLRPAGAMAYLP